MSTSYEIGPFRLDPHAKVLTRGGMPLPLGARGVTLLKVLVEHSQQYVPKSTLMDAAWPRVVGESNLAVQISAIRRVLAQAGGQQWIETLPRRGYRYVGPVKHAQLMVSPVQRLRTNLPVSVTSFIGREDERRDAAALLAQNRLLTLVGPGGIGKTRLALQVAADVLERHADGAWLVELGALRDAAQVPAVVAQALGVGERGRQAMTDTLCAHLATRDTLLVIDNCEHLLEAVGLLAVQLLHSARHATILATSREPLGIDGEQIYTVSSLSLPESDGDPERVGRSDAVRLFVARAVQQQSDFALKPHNAVTVARICTQLDGMPLALELAAARVRSLAVEQIAARLDDRFRLLAAGSTAALPRHQTLRAALEWSFDLLAEDERRVLRRIAVFAGGFRLESAMAVASDETLDEAAVVDVLDRLVRRSLVAADTAPQATRYRLLETTRAYALEKLDEAGETETLRQHHATHFSELFAAACNEWLHSADSAWWDRYLPEHDNVRTALDWAFGADGDASVGIALVGASNEIWKFFAARSESRRRVETALARVTADTPPAQQALLLLRLGVATDVYEPDTAFGALERAAEIYRQCGDRNGFIQVQSFRGHLLALMDRRDVADRILAELEPQIGADIPPRLRVGYLDARGLLAFLRGDLAAAQDALEQALQIARGMGADRFAVFLLSHLADLAWGAGDLDRAEANLREATELAGRLPQVAEDALSNCQANLVGVLVEKGRIEEALALARVATTFRAGHHTAWQAMDHLALRAALAGKLEDAARLVGYADVQYAQKSPRQRNEARARARTNDLLQERYSAGELAALLKAGASLTDAAACKLALEE